jgi:hypothetical protein
MEAGNPAESKKNTAHLMSVVAANIYKPQAKKNRAVSHGDQRGF